MFTNLGTTEIVIIALVIVLLFGGKKIPEFLKGIGEAIGEFKKGANPNDDDNDKKDEKEKDEDDE